MMDRFKEGESVIVKGSSFRTGQSGTVKVRAPDGAESYWVRLVDNTVDLYGADQLEPDQPEPEPTGEI